MSFLLSRSECARLLNRENILNLLKRVQIEFDMNYNSAYNRFFYALFTSWTIEM